MFSLSTINKNFQRRKYYASSIREYYQIDLMDLSTHGVGYLMACIDVYSRFAWVVHCKTKTKSSIQNALIEIFNKMGKPLNLQSDRESGIETLKPWFADNGINWFYVSNSYGGVDTYSAPLVERLNRTFKTWFIDYKRERKVSSVVLEYMNIFNKEYNNTVHSSIRCMPIDVWNGNKEPFIKDEEENKKRNNYRVGDYVYLQSQKSVIQERYKSLYSKEVYVISQILQTNPTTYKLSDNDGNVLDGTYYYEQLRVADLPKKRDIKKPSQIENPIRNEEPIRASRPQRNVRKFEYNDNGLRVEVNDIKDALLNRYS
jgi:hypothetical protein